MPHLNAGTDLEAARGDKVRGMNPALMIVDMQEVLLPLVWRGEELADRIASLARTARERGIPVIAVQQIGPTGTLFDPESPGTQLAARLDLQPTDVVVRKTATDAFYGTNLAALLLEWDVDTVVLAGVATDYCVDATARSSLSHGLDVVLVEDGHAPSAEGDPDAGLSAEQIIDRHNRILSDAIHPGGEVQVRPAAEVAADL
jgi:nicotinamidase-related amidase